MNSNFTAQGYISSGPAYAGGSSQPVTITKYWKSGSYANLPREVVAQNSVCYRHTAKNGWREYDYHTKTFYEGPNARVYFTPM